VGLETEGGKNENKLGKILLPILLTLTTLGNIPGVLAQGDYRYQQKQIQQNKEKLTREQLLIYGEKGIIYDQINNEIFISPYYLQNYREFLNQRFDFTIQVNNQGRAVKVFGEVDGMFVGGNSGSRKSKEFIQGMVNLILSTNPGIAREALGSNSVRKITINEIFLGRSGEPVGARSIGLFAIVRARKN